MHGEVGTGSAGEPPTGDPWARPVAPPANPVSVPPAAMPVPTAPVPVPAQPGAPLWGPGVPAAGPVPPGYPPAGWPYPPPFPAAPAPPAQNAPRRFGWGALIAVAAVTSVLGCVVGAAAGYALHRAPTSTTVAGAPVSPSQSGTAAPAATPTALGDGNALLAEILAVPAGARQTTVKGSTNGVLDLDQFATKLFTRPDQAKVRLQDRGFQVAAERDWIGTDGVEVHILLTQFEDADGAEGYTISQSLAFQMDPAYVASFPVPGATHGQGFERTGLDAAGNHRTTLIAQDGRLHIAMFFYPPHTFNRAAEIALMQRQIAAIK